MAELVAEVRPGAYFDSVVLMQLQRALVALPGVQDAGVVMATPVNLELLEASHLRPDVQAGPDDLLLVVQAEDEAAGRSALSQVDELLARRRAAETSAFRPKSLESAIRGLPEAQWVLVSVPGRFAAGVAQEALRLGKSVFLYSDNVPLQDEVALKRAALGRGLLVMGPDCGTAIVGGVGFGFANRVRRGSIGLVGASGTGLQAVTSAIHQLGGGVSQALGTGSHDLTADVGAVTARQALDLLRRDPETAVVILISKPPEPSVSGPLLAAAQSIGKPVVVDLIGLASGATRLGNLHFAASLEEAARLAVELARAPSPAPGAPAAHGYLRGLFSGGTLAYESVLALQDVLHPIATNVPLREGQQLGDPLRSRGHTLLDLGADVFTVGRLHPMIDNDLRIRRLRQEAQGPEAGLFLLDVVLGQGAHSDPASELAPAIAEVTSSGRPVILVVVGTEDDPQGMASQIERLQAAGAVVHTSLGAALDEVVRRLAPATPALPFEVPLGLLGDQPAAINVGLEAFHDSLLAQGSRSVHVDWRPPAGGDDRLMEILAKMKAQPPAPSPPPPLPPGGKGPRGEGQGEQDGH
ncbi:MAG TPA: acyl-CoA synthetase FdrA [Anaerolineales bacterium]|nr:acyl-CoA synthetase FdrA [Anaerolineales bacterium]